MSREKPRRGPSAVDKDEGAVVPQRGQLLLLLDFDQHGLGSDLEKPRFRLPHRQFSSVNFMRRKAVYASARAATLLPRDRNPEYLRDQRIGANQRKAGRATADLTEGCVTPL